MNMIANPEIYEAVNEKVMEFYLKANKIFFEATKGKLDAVLIGNDMGSQRGLDVYKRQDKWYQNLLDTAKVKRHSYVLGFAGGEINK